MAFDSTHSFPLTPPAFENDTKCLQFIKEMTRNVAAVQEKVLAKILTKNAEVEAQPQTELKPEIHCIDNGDCSPILCAHPISEFFISSGTSAWEPKLVPTTEESRDSVRFLPNEAFLCIDSFQSMYTQMLCGLLECQQVLALGAIFASGLMLELFRFLQHHWQVLINDIETDTLNQKITEQSWFGLNLNPMCKPSEVSYFEILPQEPDSDSQPPKLVDLDDFHFVGRKNVLISIQFNKTDEAELQSALYADRKTTPGHHVIYWELHVKKTAISPNNQVLNQCCLAFEESLGSVYRRARAASTNLYNVPRSVDFAPIPQLLDSRMILAHFSPALQHWSSERRWSFLYLPIA
ncbi:putative indole-3-acetic acid-amido synthetase GH3.1 [Citrus sinensis]|uniref:Indole-3-acetic acid-amido synthetase GH3.1 n=1 Tax=Citrus sinensis TaxID=2711 RepID=A0ACB8K474_CITSI|nr:putative indole-3-acetic acid-amido synthetase GH3.1 [Citrus sinensis]